MAKNQDFKQMIDEIKFHHKLLQVDVAKALDVQPTYLSDMINGRVPVTEKVMDKVQSIWGDNTYKINSSGNNNNINIAGTQINRDHEENQVLKTRIKELEGLVARLESDKQFLQETTQKLLEKLTN